MSGSNGGDRDDDIDRLIDAVRETNRNVSEIGERLERFINAIEGSARREQEEQEEISEDLWNVGQAPVGKARNSMEYIQLRRRSAHSQDLTVPQVHLDVDNLVDFFYDVYINSGEHLQRIYHALSKDDFDEFVRKLAIDYGADERLVDILEPSHSTFGIQEINDDIVPIEENTHMAFVRGHGQFWFASSATFEPERQFYSAWEIPDVGMGALELSRPDDVRGMEGLLTATDINRKMARAIDDRGDLRLPEDLRWLV